MLNIARLAAALISLLALFPSLALAQATKAGVVTTLEGHVTVTRVTLAPQALKFKDDVFVDDKVTTGDQSIARMLLGGKAVVTVRERSTLTITEGPGKATIDPQAGKIAVANSFTGVSAVAGVNVVPPPPVVVTQAPILPGNTLITEERKLQPLVPPPALPPPPPPVMQSCHHHHHRHHHYGYYRGM